MKGAGNRGHLWIAAHSIKEEDRQMVFVCRGQSENRGSCCGIGVLGKAPGVTSRHPGTWDPMCKVGNLQCTVCMSHTHFCFGALDGGGDIRKGLAPNEGAADVPQGHQGLAGRGD